MGTKDLEVIIMVNPEEYQDLEVYENIKSTFQDLKNFTSATGKRVNSMKRINRM